MFAHRSSRRLTALATASALALGAGPGWAAPPPITPPNAVPPSRVGRLARFTGTVSFHTADADHWSPATLNYPVTDGDAFWTEPGARADLQVGPSRIALASSTELDIVTLDDHALTASEPQGEVYLNLRDVPAGDTYAVQTPRGAVQIAATGRYDIVAGDADHPTTVTVVDGAAQITGTNLSLQLGPRQTATITGTDTLQGSVGPIAQDAFLTTVLAEERPAPRAGTPIPAIVQQMTGCEDVQAEGTWQETPQYGTVWYPPVDTGWVPYRHGHWSYVAPWGWTWVDEAAWGFAPFHYGRWAEIDNRWGWIPVSPGAIADPRGEYGVPAYSPALVSFIDIGAAAAIGGAIGYAAGRSVGWVPLGPREAYYPPYSRNVAYVRRLNATNIQNVSTSITNVSITNNRTVVNNFTNRSGATVVPASAMTGSAPIAGVARPLPPDQPGRAQFRSPVAPTAATAGVTRVVARQFNFVPPSRPAQPIAGPAIGPAGMRPAIRPVAAGGPPVAAPPRPGEPARPVAAGAPPVAAPPRPGEPARPVAGEAPPLAAPPRPGEPARPVAAGAPPVAAPPRPGETARPVQPAIRPAEPARPAALPPRTAPQPRAPAFRPAPAAVRPPAPINRPQQAFVRPAPPPRQAFAPPPRPMPAPRAMPAPRPMPPPRAMPPPRQMQAPRPAPPPRPSGRPGEPHRP